MTGVIDDLWKYPFKGARGHRPEFLNIDPAVGITEDRRYAIRRKAGGTREWTPKTSFFVCMNTALMAAQEPVFVGLGINQLDARYLQGLAQQLWITGELQVQDTEGVYNLCDTKGAYVSFPNLALIFSAIEVRRTRNRAVSIPHEHLDEGS